MQGGKTSIQSTADNTELNSGYYFIDRDTAIKRTK